MKTFLALALAVAATRATTVTPATRTPAVSASQADIRPPAHSYVFLWVSDSTHKASDFIAVLDADASSPRYGQVVRSLPVGAAGMAHHTEAELAPDGHLLANDFALGRTWLFDLSNATSPTILTSFTDLGGFSHPHSFIRLANGHVLATYQYLADSEPRGAMHSMNHMTDMKGTGRHFTGGLVEMTERGDLVRSGSAADPAPGARYLYPYSVAVIPGADRAISTTTDMDMADTAATSEWLQVWRVSDLKLLRSFPLPPGAHGKENRYTGEPRVLADGKSIYVHTFSCGLYLVTGIAANTPRASLVHTFTGKECGVPVLAGHYWIQTVPDTHSLVTLDVSDPAHPRQVSTLFLGKDESPHWAAIDPSGRRIIVNSGGRGKRLFMVNLDPSSGSLKLDTRFRSANDPAPGVIVTHRAWPDGFDGAASPHGAVFSR